MFQELTPLLSALTPLRAGPTLSALALMTLAYILWAGCRSGTKQFLYALLGAAAVGALIKYVFMGCAVKIAYLDIGSVPMQAALPVIILGSFGALLATQLDGPSRWIPILIMGAVILGLEAEMILVGHHAEETVGIGFVAGAAIAYAIDRYALRPNAPKLDLRLLIVLGILVVVVFHQYLSKTESLIAQTAAWFKSC